MNAIERSHRAIALHREKSASRRALVEFSISLRWSPAFRERIEELRRKWDLDPDGEDYIGPRKDGREPLPPSIEAHRNLDDGTIQFDGLALAREYTTDLGRVIEEFVPLDRFPPHTWWEDGPARNYAWLGMEHPFSAFVAFCLHYRIEDLPADIGTPPMGTYYVPWPDDDRAGRASTQITTGWAYVAFPPDASREEVYRLVDAAFATLDYAHGEQRRQPRRDVADVERTYQTWRLLREWGGSREKVVTELVRLGYDKQTPSPSTISKRVRTAEKDWGLPPIEAPPE